MNTVTPREVGYLPSVLTARSHLELALTDRQAEILKGSTLGDAYIYRQGKIQIEQSAAQKEYLFWKYSELKNLAYGVPQHVVRTDKRNQQRYESYRFWLRQYFRPWRDVFYNGKMKVFPEGLRLTPLSLAVWYMDDGCYSDQKCSFSTESYEQTSLDRIQHSLQSSFDLETVIRSNGKLIIRAKHHTRFFSIVEPHLHDSMAYKIS